MIGSPLLLTGGDYEISRSVRLRASASAYFNRTPASAGNRKTWTWSGWVKRGTLGVDNNSLIGIDSPNANESIDAFSLRFLSSDVLRVFISNSSGTSVILADTVAVFRDPSAWYHIVMALDTTQATNSNGVKLYVNGVQQTLSFTAYTQNFESYFNSTQPQYIGRSVSNIYLDGYLTEVNFIDGQALTPSSFGVTNAYGVWSPIKYNGTYGTNGFYLNFSDNSNNTATTIGKDYSGNGNNWTPNNISVTSGATYDSMLDVPTAWADGGNGRGNYCVLNPLFRGVNTPGTMQAANLELNAPNNTFWYNGVGTTFVSTGKWYAEFTPLSGTTSSVMVGVANDAYRANDFPGGTGSNGYSYVSNSGNKFFNNTGAGTAYGASFTTGDVIGVALDLDAGSLTFYKNGVSQGTAFTGIAAGNWTFAAASAAASVIAVNFGQRPFAYTPPSGFKALHTGNLPEPTIRKGNQYFDTSLYTGNAGSITVTNAGFQPDLVWIKARSSAFDHKLVDSVRGASGGIYYDLQSNSTSAESLPGAGVNGLTSTGFTIGGGTNNGYNGNGTTFAAWQWKEGATQGFDIVTYSGNGTSGRTISHSLGVTPAMMIVKSRNGADNWNVYHRSIGASNWLQLNTTSAQINDGTSGAWNNTAPTSSVFTVNWPGLGGYTNQNSVTYVAYLFSEVAGFSKFGSYTGNGSSDGPFVFCGFRPRWILLKNITTSGNGAWVMFDTARNPSNVQGLQWLFADVANSESTANSFGYFDILSNGFKCRGSGGNININNENYIYAAFAENPFKYALAR